MPSYMQIQLTISNILVLPNLLLICSCIMRNLTSLVSNNLAVKDGCIGVSINDPTPKLMLVANPSFLWDTPQTRRVSYCGVLNVDSILWWFPIMLFLGTCPRSKRSAVELLDESASDVELSTMPAALTLQEVHTT